MSVSSGGVSLGGTNPDASAAVAGGETFIARMQELKDANTKIEKAYNNLNLGKEAAAAYADAQAMQQAAMDRVTAANTESDRIITAANALAHETVRNAEIRAQSIIDAAQERAQAVDTQAEEARKALASVKEEADRILASAKSIKVSVEKQAAENKATRAELTLALEQARAAAAEADAMKALFQAKLDAIKMAAS